MANVLIVAYLLIVLALIAVILLQRSEGGGLGMGSSNSNGLISVRGSANLLTRTTAILAALFFASAIGLTILSELDRGTSSILDRASQGGQTPTTVLDAIQQMQQQSGGDLPVPGAETTTPAAPATTDGAATPAAPAGSDLPVPQQTAPAAPATEAPAADAPATTEQPAAPAN
ncbi:preprotein translocase subunit SecG [Devosia sp. ZB163]|uniref:preprotein translocase subunit SecG n=1 Tax=Devosia sp. ZB163 TaxID=3025938 RepID=UPI002361469A|nr:preprotein translocase subunit SecG [Devosia sp. ZB163]MDC9824665.1 preprotein translocase subunit SecG [Devosia sp. ZB163]